MFMPDYGTVQLLYQDRLRDIERKRRRLVLVFDRNETPADVTGDGRMQRLMRWLRHDPPAHLTRALPAHQNR